MKRFLFSFSLLLLLFGCNPISPIEEKGGKMHLKSLMDEYYYWYSHIPANVSMENSTIFQYFDKLLYSKDRWSWMMTGEAWNSSETGIYYSYGISLSQPIEYYKDWGIRVRYVHPDSPFAEHGVKRGWELTHIAGVKVERLLDNNAFYTEYNKDYNTFSFKDEEGMTHNFGVAMKEVATKSFLGAEVFTSEDFSGLPHPVAYFNYLTFNANMLDDIHAAFTTFKGAGVRDMILDLRYNGGGGAGATSLLGAYLAPPSAEGGVLAKRQHNDKHPDLNSSEDITIKRVENSLALSRLFIITGNGTASASEVIINGLDPYMDVICVGDTTYGKPNGMYAFPYPEGNSNDYYSKAKYVFLPICFFTVNKDGNGDYENGILPTNYRPDDLYHDWGVEEELTKACLTYISTGSFPSLPAKTMVDTKSLTGRCVLKREEDRADYGWDIVQFRP